VHTINGDMHTFFQVFWDVTSCCCVRNYLSVTQKNILWD